MTDPGPPIGQNRTWSTPVSHHVGTVPPWTVPSERVVSGLTASQHEAVTSRAAPLCVIAGAGSGKTRVLTRRVANRVIEGSAEPERTLVLTFTRKAAEELRKRLAHLGVAPAVNAGTFHAVAYAQLRRNWADKGLQASGGPRLPRSTGWTAAS